MMRLTSLVAFGLVLLAAPISRAGAPSTSPREQVWRFDNLQSIGGHAASSEGHPTIVEGPTGAGIRFDGVRDSVLIDGRPLVGTRAFSAEVMFKPEGGAFEQRFMHIAEARTPSTLHVPGKSDPEGRLMFEIRVVGESWYLDTFVNSAAGKQTLVAPDKLHPLHRWYAVAQTYDGTTYRAYVNGVLQAEAKVGFTPHGPGRVRIGARMNEVSHFRGTLAYARFTDRALEPGKLLVAP